MTDDEFNQACDRLARETSHLSNQEAWLVITAAVAAMKQTVPSSRSRTRAANAERKKWQIRFRYMGQAAWWRRVEARRAQ